MAPVTVNCPMCGLIIGWTRVVTAEGGNVLVRFEVDELSRRRHHDCGITPGRKGPA